MNTLAAQPCLSAAPSISLIAAALEIVGASTVTLAKQISALLF